MRITENIVWHPGQVTREDRHRINHHKSGVVWFTGLSASGKSTIAYALERRLQNSGVRSYVLDGDNLRHGLNASLGFSEADRTENLRRSAEVAKILADAGLIVLAAFITPLESQRTLVREILANLPFTEVYVKCGLVECTRRDPKGSYHKACTGQILNYTGIASPYEEPKAPNLVIDTQQLSIEQAVSTIFALTMSNVAK